MTVNASKVAVTRALSLEGNTLNAEWKEGEEVNVYDVAGAVFGMLTAQSSGVSTTLKGELTGTVVVDDELRLVFIEGNYSAHDGTLTGTDNSIDKLCDSAVATVKVTEVDGTKVSATDAAFKNQQSIVMFTFGAGALDVKSNGDAAGIGSAKNDRGNCGNITITGGAIMATGGFLAAAIGGGGGYNAETETDTKDLRAYYTVGDVTITNGVTYLTATKGEGKITEGGFGNAPATIGRGLNYQGTHETSPRYSVGTVTVGGVTGDISESPYTFPE